MKKIEKNISQWCEAYRAKMLTKGVRTTSRIEGTFGQWSKFLNGRSSVYELYERFFKTLKCTLKNSRESYGSRNS